LPVADEALVGAFGLESEFAFLLVLGAVAPDSRGAGSAFRTWCSGSEFELAEFATHESGSLVGVVLAAAEQVPGEHAEFACDCDGRDVAAATGGRASREST
jgi:hypothetical protein